MTWLGRAQVGGAKRRRFRARLRVASPGPPTHRRWDNWPVHAHPDVLARAAALGIDLLRLPPYAPWRNPIEQRWRWLTRDLLHHRLADRFDELPRRVAAWLDQFTRPAPDLPRYVGLAT